MQYILVGIQIPRGASLVPYQVILIYLYGSLEGAIGIIVTVPKGLLKSLFPKIVIIPRALLQHALLNHDTIALEVGKKLLVVSRKCAGLVFCLCRVNIEYQLVRRGQ
jgi:hypothetical protein